MTHLPRSMLAFVFLLLSPGLLHADRGPSPIKIGFQQWTRLLACPFQGVAHTYNQSKLRTFTARTCRVGKKKGTRVCDVLHANGIYKGGWRSSIWDYRLSYCISRVLKRPKLKHKGFGAIAKVAGLSLYSKKHKASEGANRYNPALFRWLASKLPEPSERSGDYEFQSIYNTAFRRLVRITAYTYLYLKTPKGKALVKKYIDAHTGAVQSTPARKRALRARIKQSVRPIITDPLSKDSGTFGAGDAALFWSRRIYGGSASAMWSMLKALMQRYDQAFLKRISKGQPTAKIRLKLPPQPKYRRSIWDNSQISQVGVAIAQSSDYIRLQLRPGVYKLGNLELPEDPSGNGKLPTRHVTVEGIGKGKVIWLVDYGKGPALFIEKASDIVIRNIHIRYQKGKKAIPCRKQAIKIANSKRVWLDRITVETPCPVGIRVMNSQDVAITRVTLKRGTKVPVAATNAKRLWLHQISGVKAKARVSCSRCTWTYGKAIKAGWSYVRSIAKQVGLALR